MNFRELAIYLDKLEKTSSRIEMTRVLADLLKKTDLREIDKVVYLALGGLAPMYKGVILNIAEKMMIRVLARAYARDVKEVVRIFKKTGDLGNVAFASAKSSNPKLKTLNLSVEDVHKGLMVVAKEGGKGSQERKIAILSDLLQRQDPLSARFVARIPVGRLRLGFSDKTVLDALSWMETGGKSSKSDLEKAYSVLPDVGLLAKAVKEKGIKKAARNVKPVVGVPVLPMLAQRLKSPEEMVEKMEKVAVEPKLDGLRLSIHYKRGNPPAGGVKAFTRNLNENSWMFPELAKIGEQIKAREAILDCEAVGLDEETKQMANFQTTMTRRRKHQIEETLKRVGLEFFVFDILFKDGENLMNRSFFLRRKVLERTIAPGKILKVVESEVTDSPSRINELYRENVKKGFEGIIVKRVDGEYVPGRTGWRWVKMKQEEASSGKLSDTIDAVVMGYTSGRGKRAGFGLGQFLVGVRDGEKVKTTTKIGTGLTDAEFREIYAKLKNLKTKKQPKEYEVHKNYTPDFWVIPSLVVEIAADEITKSPVHTAGLALRFPRLIRFRDDKNPSGATTVSELEGLFKMQKS